MARESTQHKLDRVRPPRVQITYDLQVGDAIQQKELPFLIGVLGDFSGQPAEPRPKLKDRKFVDINRDNFDSVLAGLKSHLSYKVDNRLGRDETEALAVNLDFRSIRDFEPDRVAEQVEPLRQMIEARNKLADLKRKLFANEKLEERLQEILTSTEQMHGLSAKSNVAKGDVKAANAEGSE